MLSFLRRGPRDPRVEAAAFWRRWSRLRPVVADALAAGELHAVEPRVAAAVARMHPRLGWSLAGGDGDAHVLVVTGEGDEGLRELTDAWLAEAPDDADWEYHDSAQAMDDPGAFTLGIGDVDVALADVRVHALVDGDVVHVAVHHPVMPGLRGEDRDALCFVALDTALGERLVEERVGHVEPVDAEPGDALTLVELRELVAAAAV